MVPRNRIPAMEQPARKGQAGQEQLIASQQSAIQAGRGAGTRAVVQQEGQKSFGPFGTRPQAGPFWGDGCPFPEGGHATQAGPAKSAESVTLTPGAEIFEAADALKTVQRRCVLARPIRERCQWPAGSASGFFSENALSQMNGVGEEQGSPSTPRRRADSIPGSNSPCRSGRAGDGPPDAVLRQIAPVGQQLD